MKNRFLKIFLILGLIIATAIGCYAFSFRNITLDFVQISDTHISQNSNTPYKALGSSGDLLKDAVEQINDIVGLDFVLFTGDMVDSARYDNFYDFYKILTKLKYPSLNAFGNHEFYGGMSKEEVLATVKGYNPNYIFNDTYYAFSPKTDYRIIVLDSTIKNQNTSMGEISNEQLAFLDDELANNQDKVVVIAMHHPPVQPFISKDHSIVNASEFNEILLKYRNPIVVLSGHYHAAKIRRIGNIVYVSTPSMVTYPMGFRHIKITNYKDRVVFNFDFFSTGLQDVKEANRQSVISYATLAGYEKDRQLQFVFDKKHPKSAKYKRNKIKKTEKETKTSNKELKKLTQPQKVKMPKQKKIKKNKKVTPQEI